MCSLKEKSLYNTRKRSLYGKSFSSVCVDLYNTSFLIDDGIQENSESIYGLQTIRYIKFHVQRIRIFNKSRSTRLNGNINPNLFKRYSKIRRA